MNNSQASSRRLDIDSLELILVMALIILPDFLLSDSLSYHWLYNTAHSRAFVIGTELYPAQNLLSPSLFFPSWSSCGFYGATNGSTTSLWSSSPGLLYD